MKKILLSVFLMISSTVYAAEYDIIEVLTYNPDQTFYAGDKIYVNYDYNYTGELHETASKYSFLMDSSGFYGWFGHREKADDLTYSYVDNIGHVGAHDSSITIPDMGDNCSWRVKPFDYSQTQLFFYTDDDECVASKEFSCHYDCERNTYRCAINMKNYNDTLQRIYDSPYFCLSGVNCSDYKKSIRIWTNNGGNGLTRDLSIISNFDSIIGNGEKNISIDDDTVTLHNLQEFTVQNIIGKNFEYLSFDIDPTLIDGSLEIEVVSFEPIILSEEVPECKPGESIVTTTTIESGKVLGDNANPKTGVKNYGLYLIPIMIMFIISAYIKYKDRLFKKI